MLVEEKTSELHHSGSENPITYDILFQALKNTFKQQMDKAAIEDLTYYLLNFFGFDGAVLDNILTPSDRDVFYTLEEMGILSTEQDEVVIKRGKLWRIHYWVMRTDNIKRLAGAQTDDDEEDNMYKLYDNLSDEMWQRK